MKIILKTTLHCSKVYAFATILIVIRCGKTLINRLAPTPIWWFESSWVVITILPTKRDSFSIPLGYHFFFRKSASCLLRTGPVPGQVLRHVCFISYGLCRTIVKKLCIHIKKDQIIIKCTPEVVYKGRVYVFKKLILFKVRHSLIPRTLFFEFDSYHPGKWEQLQPMKWVILLINDVCWKLNIGMEALSCISLVQFCSKSKWRLW